jgi:hypothetical protein
MKKALFSVIISIFIAAPLMAQQQVPNGDFEDWETHVLGFEYPVGWDNPNAVLSLFGLTPVMPSTDAAHGNYSAYLESKLLNADGEFVIPGVVTLGTFVVDYVNSTATMEGGIPFTDRPPALTGSYKNFPAEGDSTMVVVIFTRYMGTKGKRDTLAVAGMFSKETVENWTTFAIPINFYSEDSPDTMNIIVVSSNMIQPNKDSKMYIDNLAFDYSFGIGEAFPAIETSVFPNPANNELSMSFDRQLDASLSIFSNEGQLLYTGRVNGVEHHVDVSAFAAGTYYFTIFEKNRKTGSGQFVISR